MGVVMAVPLAFRLLLAKVFDKPIRNRGCLHYCPKSYLSSCPTGRDSSKSHDELEMSTNTSDIRKWLMKEAPVFGIDGRNVTVLKQPWQFYDALVKGVSNAKKRIVLASLYLGTSKYDHGLVASLSKALENSKTDTSESNLKVTILLDYTRGSRGTTNSRTMLLPLLKQHVNQMQVNLYHTPDLRGILKQILPERYNEVQGLLHFKVYVFDDSFIMTGANLSESYFTNRQDRYIHFCNCPQVADYLEGLVKTVSEFSLNLKPDNSTQLHCGFPFHPFESNSNSKTFKSAALERIQNFLTFHKSPSLSPTADTWIFPLLQMKPFSITQDEKVTQKFLKNATQRSNIYLTTGYFNLTEHNQNLVLSKSLANFHILTAAPEVNGFFGSRGLSGGIPDAYTLIEKWFMQHVTRLGQEDRIKLYEFVKNGWTFHSKGLWYYLPNQNLPVVTFIGSPNFGYRSVYRDLETQLVVVTNNEALQLQLHEEQRYLYNSSYAVNETVLQKPERFTPLWVHLVTRFARNYF